MRALLTLFFQDTRPPKTRPSVRVFCYSVVKCREGEAHSVSGVLPCMDYGDSFLSAPCVNISRSKNNTSSCSLKKEKEKGRKESHMARRGRRRVCPGGVYLGRPPAVGGIRLADNQE